LAGNFWSGKHAARKKNILSRLAPKKVKWISLLFPTKIHSYYFHSKNFENNSSDIRCTGSLGRSI
jgi:hypothetical protein